MVIIRHLRDEAGMIDTGVSLPAMMTTVITCRHSSNQFIFPRTEYRLPAVRLGFSSWSPADFPLHWTQVPASPAVTTISGLGFHLWRMRDRTAAIGAAYTLHCSPADCARAPLWPITINFRFLYFDNQLPASRPSISCGSVDAVGDFGGIANCSNDTATSLRHHDVSSHVIIDVSRHIRFGATTIVRTRWFFSCNNLEWIFSRARVGLGEPLAVVVVYLFIVRRGTVTSATTAKVQNVGFRWQATARVDGEHCVGRTDASAGCGWCRSD